MREWKEAAELDADWISAVHAKLKSLLFHLREYLLTNKITHRKIILRAMYEDFSDANQLIEKVTNLVIYILFPKTNFNYFFPIMLLKVYSTK